MRRFALLALIPFVLAACGSDSSTPTAASTNAADDLAQARAAYIAEADALCTGFGADHPELGESIQSIQALDPADPSSLPAFADHFDLVRTLAGDFEDGFAELDPPDDDRAQIDALNARNEEALDVLDKIVAGLRSGTNPTALFQTYGSKIAGADALAADYGFQVCSRQQPG